MKTTLTTLLDDDGAVSPVIGVILMVAITVILAAVIGTFVLGLGGQVSQTAPQASISTEDVGTSPESFTFQHGGSDTINFDELDITISVGGSNLGTYEASTGNSSLQFSTADTLVVNGSGVFLNGGGSNVYGSTISLSFSPGTEYTVTFVDQPSGQIIAEKTGTA